MARVLSFFTPYKEDIFKDWITSQINVGGVWTPLSAKPHATSRIYKESKVNIECNQLKETKKVPHPRIGCTPNFQLVFMEKKWGQGNS